MSVCFDRASLNSTLFFCDFASKELYEYSLSYVVLGSFQVVDVAPNFRLIRAGNWLSVLNVSDNKIIASLRSCELDRKDLSNLFYLSSKDLLLVVIDNDIKFFKIHKLEKILKL